MALPKPSQIGRYKVLRTLGEGGMGAVFLAEDPAIDRLLAIKLMRKGFDDGQMRERFTREARAIGKLRHPNIVMVFDVGEHDGDPFIAMEYVEGETLSGVIRSNPDMPVGRKLEIMDALCSGLYYAHRNGVIHRDIKPPNIMVDTEGGVKILDFGIARGPASGMTQAGTVIGTLNYMAPEQLAGKRVDLRADIWAVGALFYELLTGQQAFPGDISSGVLHQILMGQPAPLAQVVPGLHPEIIATVDRCLQKNPDDRFADLDLMRRALSGLKNQAWTAEVAESTIRMPSLGSDPGQTPRASRTPGPDTRAQLLKLREDRIAQQLADARTALESRDYTRAMEACQQALIIDPEHGAAQELQDQVRGERQAHGLVVDARAELDRGAVTSASRMIEQALVLAPALAEALRLRDEVGEARRRQEAQAARLRAIEAALARGREQMASGVFDEAMASVAEVHRLDPGNAEAARLSRDVEAGRAAKARADEDARAARAVSDARQQFAAGRYDRALGMLREYRPGHPAVMEALQALERERGEIQRREAREAEERKRREAEERQRREAEERRQRDAEERQRREAEDARRRAAEAERKAAEEAERTRAQAEAEARRAREQAEARRREEAEARRREEAEAKRQAEADAKRRAEAEARQRAEADAKRRAGAEATRREREREEAARREAARVEDDVRVAKTELFSPDQTVVLKDLQGGNTVLLPDAAALAATSGVQAPAPPRPDPAGETAMMRGGDTVLITPGETVVLKDPAVPRPRPVPPPVPVPEPPVDREPDVQVRGGDVVPWRLPVQLPLPWIGAAAAVLLAVVGYFAFSGPSVPEPQPGPAPGPVLPPQTLTLQVQPWANIDAITNKATGERVATECTTSPCVVSLPPGEYHVQANNPALQAAGEFDFRVVAGETTPIVLTFPVLNAAEEARRIIEGR